MVSSRDAGHHRESVGLHPTPCTEQPFNRDLRIPAVCLSGFLLSVSPQAVPARFTPAFWLSLVRSCHGRHFPGKSYWLVADDSVVKEHEFSIIELEKACFARCFQNIHRFFAFSANRNPQGRFHIQFFEIFKISHTHDAEHRGCEMNFIEPIGRNGRFCMRVWGAESPSRCPVRKAQMGFRVTPGESCPDECASSKNQ